MKWLYLLIDWATWPIRTFRTWLAKRAAYRIVKESLEASVSSKASVKYELKWNGDDLTAYIDLHRPIEHINVDFTTLEQTEEETKPV